MKLIYLILITALTFFSSCRKCETCYFYWEQSDVHYEDLGEYCGDEIENMESSPYEQTYHLWTDGSGQIVLPGSEMGIPFYDPMGTPAYHNYVFEVKCYEVPPEFE